MKQWDAVYIGNDADGVASVLEANSMPRNLTFSAQGMIEQERPELPSTENEYLYFGLDRTFDGIYLGLEGGSSEYDQYPIHEYWNDSSWQRLPLQNSISFQEDGVSRFPIPANWKKGGINRPSSADEDDDNYYVRVRGTDITTIAKMVDSFPFPSYSLTTPEECSALMGLRIEFTNTTLPSREDVERLIRRIEGRIEGYTTLSWKPQYRENEDYNFNRRGFVLKRTPIIKMFPVEIWQSGGYRTLREGRTAESEDANDYFVTNRTGIVTFSRFFHLPFGYSRVRAYGLGENRQPIRARYIWGRDELDDRYYMAKDVATKLVVADIWSSYDLGALLPQGSDRFGVDSRIERWTSDSEERLEELRPLRLFVP